MTDLAIIESLLRGDCLLDDRFVEVFADLAGRPAPDIRMIVRGALRAYDLTAPSYEVRTGGWRLDLEAALVKAISCGVLTTLALQALGEHSIPAAVVAAVAPFVVEVERVELSAGDYWVYLRLLEAADGEQLQARELYERLPNDIKQQVSMRDYATILERLRDARVVHVGPEGVCLGDGFNQGTRLLLS